MSRLLQTRVVRLEARQSAAPADPSYSPPMPSEAWWGELAQILETSPYRDAILGQCTEGEGEAWRGGEEDV